MNLVFFNRVQVGIQGDQVLSVSDDTRAESIRYTILGFERHQLTLEDRRSQSRQYLAAYRESANLGEFLACFHHPALLTVYQAGNSDYLFILADPVDRVDPEYTFWVAIGIDDLIAFPEDELHLAEPYGNGRFALVAIHPIAGSYGQSPMLNMDRPQRTTFCPPGTEEYS